MRRREPAPPITPRRILITGASGCIGHHVTDALIQDADTELYLFVRDPRRVRLDRRWRPGITVVPGDMRDIGQFADLLKTVDVAILAATAWGGPDAREINVVKTLELLNLLDPRVCRQVIYFSTASVLDRQNQPLKEAGELGTYYIRSKYEALRRLPDLAIAPNITILSPTLVFGGDANTPHSFLSIDLPGFTKWVNLFRFLSVDGSFHFIHARDVAQVVRYLVDHPEVGGGLRSFVLGQEALTFDQAAEQICAALDKRIYFRIPLPVALFAPLVPLFQKHMLVGDRAWGAFCLRYRHFTHSNPTNPATFGLPNYCPTLADAQQISGIFRSTITEAARSHSRP